MADNQFFEDISARLDVAKESVILLQRELTSRPALGPENGGSGEHEKSEYIKQVLQDMNPDVLEEIRAPDPRAKDGYRPNLVALWKGEQKGGRVWVLCHSDIVPPGDLSLWDHEPYEIKVQGDKIYGRGVEDNQHAFVSAFLAIKAIFETGRRPARDVGIAVVADEETGSRYGLQYLLNEHPDLFKEDDLIIVPDGGNRDGTMVEIAEKSILWVRFTVNGKQCHASTPEKGRNSLVGAAALIMELQDLKNIFSVQDELFSPPRSTFEPTKVEANVLNINTIPGKDTFYLDCRILPAYQVQEVLEECKKMASSVGKNLGLSVDVEVSYKQEAPSPTPKEAPVVLALSRAIRKVMGKEARPMGIGGGTVAAFFRHKNLPAAVWCTSPDTAHQPNEYCIIPDIIQDAKVLAYIYLGLDRV